jgi:hypothetical protein
MLLQRCSLSHSAAATFGAAAAADIRGSVVGEAAIPCSDAHEAARPRAEKSTNEAQIVFMTFLRS